MRRSRDVSTTLPTHGTRLPQSMAGMWESLWENERLIAATLIYVVLFIGLALRFYTLGAKSLWVDEAYSYDLTRGSVARIWQTLVFDHVPAYFVLLWGWVRVFGDSEWGLRSLSAVSGTITIAAVGAITREVAGHWTATSATLFAALSPIGLFWSQEAKPEAMAMACAAWSSCLMIAGLKHDVRPRVQRTYLALYLMVTVVGLYTLYYYPFIVLSQAVALVVWSVTNTSFSAVWPMLVIQTVAMASMGVWLIGRVDYVIASTGSYVISRMSPGQFMIATASAIIAGDPWGYTSLQMSRLLILVLCLAGVGVGCIVSILNWRSLGNVLLASWLIVPISSAYVLQLWIPAYQTRYLLGSVPAAHILLAIGITCLPRRHIRVLRVLALCVLAYVIVIWTLVDARLPDDLGLAHQGFREVTQYFLAHRADKDILSGDPAWLVVAVDYYLRGQGQYLEIADKSSLEIARRIDASRAAGANGAWIVFYGDSPNRIEQVVKPMSDLQPEHLERAGLSIRHYRFKAP
jgi:mannosyltransferase